jgi:hypothetical protein
MMYLPSFFHGRIMEDLNSTPSPLLLSTATAPSFSPTTVVSVSPVPSTMTYNRRNTLEVDVSSPDSADIVVGDDVSNEYELGERINYRGPDNDDDESDNHDDHIDRRGRGGERRGRTTRTILAARDGRQQSRTISTRATLNHRQRWRQHQPLPFLLPISMAQKIDQIVQNYRDHRYNHHPISSTEDSNSNWTINRALAALRLGNVLYECVATSPSAAATTRQYSVYRRHRSQSPSSPGRDDSIDDRDEDDVELGRLRHPSVNTTNSEDSNSLYHRSPSSSSNDGLRRRSPTRRRGSGGLYVHGGADTASPRLSIPHLHGSLPRDQIMSHRVGERGITPSPNSIASNTASTIGGIGSSNGDGTDDSDNLGSSSSSEDNDSDDDNTDDGDNDRRHGNNISHYHANDLGGGGCSQLNLYGAMRLSLIIAIIHIFVLTALHATYIGPYAFRVGNYEVHQQNWQSHKHRWLQRTHRGRIDDDWIAVMSGTDQYEKELIVGDTSKFDEIESDDDWDPKIEGAAATTRTRKTISTNDSPVLVNCISYALFDRPVEGRSKYVENEDNKAGPTDRRRLSNEMKGNLDNRNNVEEERRKWHHNGYYFDDQLSQSSVGNSVGEVEDDDDNFLRVMSESIGTAGSSSDGYDDAPNSAPAPLLGKDEILQIKILYGGGCAGKCSRVHKVNYEEGSNILAPDVNSSDGQHRRQDHLLRGLQRRQKEQIDDGLLLSSSHWEQVHYRYARDDALLHLDEKTLSLHNITLVNVTLTERCLSTGSDDGK